MLALTAIIIEYDPKMTKTVVTALAQAVYASYAPGCGSFCRYASRNGIPARASIAVGRAGIRARTMGIASSGADIRACRADIPACTAVIAAGAAGTRGNTMGIAAGTGGIRAC